MSTTGSDPHSNARTELAVRPRVVYTVMCLSIMTFSMLQSLVAPALLVLQRELDTDQNTVTWVMTAYLLSAALCTPILGRIGDATSKVRLFIIVLLLLAAGCLVAAVAPNITVLIIGRAVQGAGGALLPLGFGIIRDCLAPDAVARAIAVAAGLLAVGAGVGTLAAGPLVDHLGWPWLFWLPLAVLVTLAVVTWRTVPERGHRHPGRINWLAALLLSVWLIALLLPVSKGTTWGWTSPTVLGLMALALLTFVGWIYYEIRTDAPLIDMRMMRQRTVWTANIVALMFGAMLYGLITFLPEYLQAPKSTGYGYGASVTVSGLLMLPYTIISFFAGLYATALIARFGARLTVVAAALASAISTLAIPLLPSNMVIFFAIGGLGGFGIGLAYSALSAMIVVAVPVHQTGAAAGMNANLRIVGGAIGAAVVSSVVTARFDATGHPAESAFHNGLFVLGGLSVAAALVAFAIPLGRIRPNASPDVVRTPELALLPGGPVVEETREPTR